MGSGYYKSGGKILKAGMVKLDKMLNSPYVFPHHKVILRAIKNNSSHHNCSKTDIELFMLLAKQYNLI